MSDRITIQLPLKSETGRFPIVTFFLISKYDERRMAFPLAASVSIRCFTHFVTIATTNKILASLFLKGDRLSTSCM